MVSDAIYDLCLPVLQDSNIEDEDKPERIAEVLTKETALTGQILDNAVLNVMWRFREGPSGTSSPPPMRQIMMRRPSPASWQMPRGNTPLSSSPRLGVSPLAPPGFMPPGLSNRAKTSGASPFTSPRPSPRLAFSSPSIPHSPSLNAYQFPNDTSPTQEIYGDYGSDNVDWLVNDDAISTSSSTGGGYSGLNAAAAEYIHPQQSDMSPMEILRSVFQHAKSDEEIETALETNGYDLSAAMMTLMADSTVQPSMDQTNKSGTKAVQIGKSMDVQRPVTPAGQQRSGVVCRFWLSTGQCLRADCRFSHDLSNHICKYWVMGNCLAGDTCIFSHDPTHFIGRLSLDESSTPPLQGSAPSFQFQDYNAFPSLQPLNSYQGTTNFGSYPQLGFTPPSGLKGLHDYSSDGSNQRSRPNSRHQARDNTPAAPALDDTEAFPSLGAVAGKGNKKHHGKRGGHGHAKENASPSSLADVVKMSPSPGPSLLRQEFKKMGRNGSSSNMRSGENGAAAQAIPSPQHIPWLETGDKANKAYLKARQDAIKHGGLRNKFLQSAAQAWNRNDARAAKALSLRGQSENDLMRKAHREAARELYEERNRGQSNGELYVDLHGLHPEEAVEYLERVLLEHSNSGRPVYAITGTGHHSKNGKDKVGKAVRSFLGEWRYAYREFSVPGDRNNVGGILGIDAGSWDRSLQRECKSGVKDGDEVDLLSQGHEIGDGKVRLLVRDPPKGPAAGRR